MFDSRLVTILVESFPKILIPGLVRTLPLTAISFSLAMAIAVAVALVQFANVKGLKQLCRLYIWIIRGTPLLVQLFVVFYGLPHVGVVIDPFPAAVAVFSINEGAYAAEIIRAALESVPGGQLEAGACVGMSYLQIMGRIVLPQALRTAFPSLANSLIAMVKDTSLASVVTVAEMMMATKQLNALYYEPLPSIWRPPSFTLCSAPCSPRYRAGGRRSCPATSGRRERYDAGSAGRDQTLR